VTDDIVTRLRELADAFDDDDISHDQGSWMRSAADEIERLRAELEIYKDLYAREAVERTMAEQVKESAHWVADMMNKGNVNPKDVYPKGRYSGD
jgi:hypothetical protein